MNPDTALDTRRCLTVKQPWAWAILFAGKDIENRIWPTRYRGPLFIHAGRGFDDEGFAWCKKHFPYIWPEKIEFRTGGIIGSVELVRCTQGMDLTIGNEHPASRWSKPGHWHWLLANPTPIPFEPCRGAQGIWIAGNQRRVMELPAGFTIKTKSVPVEDFTYFEATLHRDGAPVFTSPIVAKRAAANHAAMREAHRLNALPSIPASLHSETCECTHKNERAEVSRNSGASEV